MNTDPETLKRAVALHWELEPCGIRGLEHQDQTKFFADIERERYAFEPHIRDFARFEQGAGLRVLEVGVGAGSDYVNWLRKGARASGLDLTSASLRLTKERCREERLLSRLSQADCEQLPFGSETFDLVYSYGVIHHSPDTKAAVNEIHRVLRPDGVARVMIYHAPSITAFILWTIHCLLKGRPWRSPRWAVAHYLESAGTKTYSISEARELFSDFKTVSTNIALGTGDLLLMRPSGRYRGRVARVVWRLYPRAMIRRFGARLGLCLLIEARK